MSPVSEDLDPDGELSPMEVSYLKLLEGLKGAAGYGAEDRGVVQRIAAWIDAESVLVFICLTQRWFDDWEIKEALLRNDNTPVEFRQQLERQIAIFDLLRELDSPRLSSAERNEIQEDLRLLFRTLDGHDREVVRRRAYSLSSSRSGAEPTVEAAPPPAAPATGESSKEPELQELFQSDAEPERDPEDGTAFETFAIEASREAPVHRGRDTSPEEEAAEEPSPPAIDPEIQDLFRPPTDELDPTAWSAEEEPSEAALTRTRELELASTTDDLDLLRVLAGEADEQIQLELLDNPALSENLVAAMARRAGPRVAQEIYRRRRWFARPAVRRALLDCPSAPAAALLEIVGGSGQLGELLGVLANPKVRHLEVKAKARSSLQMRFRSLAGGEKVAAVRRHGRPLLKHLWSDFFRDEALVLRCLEGRQLDSASVLEIARSKIAPRRALEAIGKSSAWTAQYPVRLALVHNPKTPRQVAARLVSQLSPADRRAVRSNPAIAEAVRRNA